MSRQSSTARRQHVDQSWPEDEPEIDPYMQESPEEIQERIRVLSLASEMAQRLGLAAFRSLDASKGAAQVRLERAQIQLREDGASTKTGESTDEL